MAPVAALVGVLAAQLLFFSIYMSYMRTAAQPLPIVDPCPPQPYTNHILVLYAYNEADSDRLDNLKYFIQVMHASATHPSASNVTYVFIINGGNVSTSLPSGRNIHVLHRNNSGYDFGAWSAGLQLVNHTLAEYRHFIFLNSGVSGPHLPSYVEHPWYEYVTVLVDDEVKLVGSTINCFIAPHVQSYFLVTDRVGLDVALRHGILHLDPSKSGPENYQEAVLEHEVKLSRVMVVEGYNIACLLKKYKGVDFRKHENWNCNAQMNPTAWRSMDGASVSPLEVMFVKNKPGDGKWRQLVHNYAHYTGSHSVVPNRGHNTQPRFDLLFHLARECGFAFDKQAYVNLHMDVREHGIQPLQHFTRGGFAEGRAFRFKSVTSTTYSPTSWCQLLFENPTLLNTE